MRRRWAPRRKGSPVQRVCSGLLNAQVAVTLAVAGACACGWSLWWVQTGSMEPTVATGSLAVCRPMAEGEDLAGEVVAFDAGAATVVHRVVGAGADGLLVTQGDANKTPDEAPVARAQVRGVVVLAVPVLGAVAERCSESPVAAGVGALAVEGALVAGCAAGPDAWREARRA